MSATSIEQLKFFFTALTSAKSEEEMNKIIEDSNLLMAEAFAAIMPHVIKVTQAFSSIAIGTIVKNKDAIIMIAPTVLSILNDVKVQYKEFDKDFEDIDVDIQKDINVVVKQRMSKIAKSVALISNEFKAGDSKLTDEQIDAAVIETCKAKEAKMDQEIEDMIWRRKVNNATIIVIEHQSDNLHTEEAYAEAQSIIKEGAKRNDIKRNA